MSEPAADETDRDACSLCGLPTPNPPITDEAVDGAFCCQGCLTVQQAIGAEELSSDDIPVRPSERVTAAEVPDDAETCFLSIDGMHCTTCERFLAGRGGAIEGIYDVTASYATDTARVRFDPDRLDVPGVAEALSGYGYTAKQRATGMSTDAEGNPYVGFLLGGGLFGMMVMIWYAIFLYPTYLGYPPVIDPAGFGGRYVAANIWLFTSFVVFYTGWPILRGAVVSLRARVPNMDLLVATAVLGAYGYSTLAMGLGRSDLYFDVSVAIVLVVTAGTYYERRIKRRAVGALRTDVIAGAREVQRADGSTVQHDALCAGDHVVVPAGERIPLDGTVVDGNAAVDTALVTGEPVPTHVGPGDDVPGGAVVTDAPLVVEVGAAAESTRQRLLEQLWAIHAATPGTQRLADRLATVFVPLVLVVAALTGVAVLATGGAGTAALLVALTVVIVSCPCALGLATPLAIAAGIRSAAERGMVIAGADLFETAPAIDIVVLDKTGTLTEAGLAVTAVHGQRVEDILANAAAVEQFSAHPIADAIVDHARAVIDWTPPTTARTDGGVCATAFDTDERGVSAIVDGTRIVVGHPAYVSAAGLDLPDDLAERVDTVRADGDVPVVVGWDEQARGVIAVGTTTRPTADAALSTLAAERDVVVLTGDEGPSADAFREHPAIDAVFAGVPPDGKVETIRRFQRRGRVAMVGDGSNDAPALAAADLGIALADGTAMATDAADTIIRDSDLRRVGELFEIVTGTNRRLRQNLGWAFAYNAVAIPVAMAGLLNPLVAAVAMASSSALVVVNSVRPIGAE